MIQSFKLVFVVAALASGVLVIAKGLSASAATNEMAESSASRAIYRTHCAECHGNDGRGNTKRGRETEANDLTEPGVKGNAHDKNIRIITNGKGEMPGFKGKLSTAQIASVASYIKGL